MAKLIGVSGKENIQYLDKWLKALKYDVSPETLDRRFDQLSEALNRMKFGFVLGYERESAYSTFAAPAKPSRTAKFIARLYYYATVPVVLELAFPVVAAAFGHFTGSFGLHMIFVPAIAIVFALSHRNMSLQSMPMLMLLCAGMTMPFVLSGYTVDATALSLVIHSAYNALVVLLEYAGIKPDWLPLASTVGNNPFEEFDIEDLHTTMLSNILERDKYQAAQQPRKVMQMDEANVAIIDELVRRLTEQGVVKRKPKSATIYVNVNWNKPGEPVWKWLGTTEQESLEAAWAVYKGTYRTSDYSILSRFDHCWRKEKWNSKYLPFNRFVFRYLYAS
jgi:hypothetical protein